MNREIDERIAKAMGWTWDDDWGCLIPPEQKAKPNGMWTDWQRDDDVDEFDEFWRKPVPGAAVSGIVYNGDMSKIILPEYRTDWATAEQIVKWMREQGWIIAAEWDKRGCSVWVSAESKLPAWVTGPEFPEALCRAFLEVMEVER